MLILDLQKSFYNLGLAKEERLKNMEEKVAKSSGIRRIFERNF